MTTADYTGCDIVRNMLRVSKVEPGKIPVWLKEILKIDHSPAKLSSSEEWTVRVLERLIGERLFDH